jgi:quercetin dioxygenase-like cupin family protein
MKILRREDQTGRRGPAEWFAGDVWMEDLVRGTEPSRLQAVRVSFAPGARTAWHTHPVGQTLHILSGEGRVQLRGERVRTMHVGDTVVIAPGEMHWHGAAPDQSMMHLAIQEYDENGVNVEWFEHVRDEEYGVAA